MNKTCAGTWAAAVMVLFAGCASVPPTSVESIVEADDSMVAGCRYLGDVVGRSPTGATRGQDVAGNTAKVRALDRAAKLGATHVVWIGTTNVDPARAEARAYACRRPGASQH